LGDFEQPDQGNFTLMVTTIHIYDDNYGLRQSFDDNTHILDAICAGASGYLLKKSVSEKLV